MWLASEREQAPARAASGRCSAEAALWWAHHGGLAAQAGTLSGNPLAMVAGLTTLQILDRPGTYEYLEKITDRLMTGLLSAAREAGHEVCGGHISGALPRLSCRQQQPAT